MTEDKELERDIEEMIDQLVPYTEVDNYDDVTNYINALIEFADWNGGYYTPGLYKAICEELSSVHEYMSGDFDIIEEEYVSKRKIKTLAPKGEEPKRWTPGEND